VVDEEILVYVREQLFIRGVDVAEGKQTRVAFHLRRRVETRHPIFPVELLLWLEIRREVNHVVCVVLEQGRIYVLLLRQARRRSASRSSRN
jgi:hypothetical protein